jgi:acetoin utilization deacetylase AcuC-like enzyme
MKTFFRPEMNVQGNSSFSPSAGKPKQFIEYLLQYNIKVDIDETFSPLVRQDLSLAHDTLMVNQILDLKRMNGFGNTIKAVAESLPYTSGSFYAAAKWALENQTTAFSPTSGFHHACFSTSGGFCTFNGLMISALKLKNEKQVRKIGIIDCDEHYGNGTDDIIGKLNLGWVKHYTFGNETVSPVNAEKWLLDFEKKLKDFKDCDVIFYQGGADPHINDPLGGTLTTEQMRKRDELLFSTMHKFKIPVAWNLAGGYQNPLKKVLDLHKTTYEIALNYTTKE